VHVRVLTVRLSMSSTETASLKPTKLTPSSNWEVWSVQFEEHVRLKGVCKWLTVEPTAGGQEELSGDATCKRLMLLSTPVEALVRLIKGADNAKAALTALKEDIVGRDRVRRHEINRESKEFRQKKGESFMLYCDRAADHYSKLRLSAEVHSYSLMISFSVCPNPSVRKTCLD
jgi:hypothetical protein